MKIGVLPALAPTGGGVYQYGLAVLRALHEWHRSEGSENEFLILMQRDGVTKGVPQPEVGWEWVELPQSNSWIYKIRRMVGRAGGVPARQLYAWFRSRRPRRADPATVRRRPDLDAFLRSHGIDIMVYPAPVTMSFEAETPCILAVHDLQHRLQPEFPEVSSGGEWEQREYLFRNGTRAALRVMVDSEVGKEDVLALYGSYGVAEDKIRVLPFLPAPYLEKPDRSRTDEVKRHFDLPDDFIFYPAQFWPHKNHLRLVEALHHLDLAYGCRPPLVLVGSYGDRIRRDTYLHLKKTWQRLGLEGSIYDLGQVSDEFMAPLYDLARGLVFPTFFGPTNIPILEAWAYGCPVITSNIRGIREQVGNDAILVDPRSSVSIAEGIHRLWTDSTLRRELAERGRARILAYTPDDFRDRLIAIVEEAMGLIRGRNE